MSRAAPNLARKLGTCSCTERVTLPLAQRPCFTQLTARISDMDILVPFGKVAFSNSGAQSKLLPVIAAANLYDVSAEKAYSAFTNDPGRPSPVDHMADPRALLAAAPDAELARDIGFVFSEKPPVGGTPVSTVTATWP